MPESVFPRPRPALALIRGGAAPEHPDRGASLGDCPVCLRTVTPDGGALRLHGAFFHGRCALTGAPAA